jgi:hypothetical protein
MDLIDKMRRHLFPTADEAIEELRFSQANGRTELALEHGFSVGDTVYLDGKYECTIDNAAMMSGAFTTLQVYVAMTGNVAADATGQEAYRGHSKVIIPCNPEDLERFPVLVIRTEDIAAMLTSEHRQNQSRYEIVFSDCVIRGAGKKWTARELTVEGATFLGISTRYDAKASEVRIAPKVDYKPTNPLPFDEGA